MRALLLHCKEYGVIIGRLANRPEGIRPEEIEDRKQRADNCVVAFITSEKGDGIEKVTKGMVSEIEKMCKEVHTRKIVILPFAHLSNNLEHYDAAIKTMKIIEGKLKEYTVIRAHFGSHKELLIHLYGHPGNARYREF